MGRGLSEQQESILVWLLKTTKRARVEYRSFAECWGIEWQRRTRITRHRPGTSTPSVSRSLRRLEERGLILRQNDVSGTGGSRRSIADPAPTRTTCVVLTTEGVRIAEQLSVNIKTKGKMLTDTQ